MQEALSEMLDIELHPGDQHRIKLGGLGSAGYAWEYLSEGDREVLSASIESLPMQVHPQQDNLPPDSFSAEKMVVIRAIKPGVCRLRLFLRRPWETEKPPLKEIQIEVQIKSR